MRRATKHVIETILSDEVQMFVINFILHFYLRILFWYYGMVSLGQYVVNCWFPSGSKPSLKYERRDNYSSFANFKDRKERKDQVLDAKKLIEEEKKLYCEKNKNSKEGFYDNINNLRIENSAKNKGPKNKGDECFCRSSQTQFRSTTPRRVKNSLRLRRLFNDNEHQQENEFLCDCGSSKNETIYKGIHENISNGNSFGCGILPFLKNLFHSQNQSSYNETYGGCHSQNRHIFNFMGASTFTTNSNPSIEYNDRNISYISTECAADEMYEMSERKQIFSRNPHDHKEGCDNISFEMEFLSSFEQDKAKMSSKMVKENKENMTTQFCETAQLQNESPSRRSILGSNISCIHPEGSFSSRNCKIVVITIRNRYDLLISKNDFHKMLHTVLNKFHFSF